MLALKCSTYSLNMALVCLNIYIYVCYLVIHNIHIYIYTYICVARNSYYSDASTLNQVKSFFSDPDSCRCGLETAASESVG